VALTDEQRAMVQLLLEGGQGYEDIGSLLGIPPDEVRNRARAALREMAGTDPDAQVPLSDYLLGQADPIGRADAVRHLQSDPEANAVAERLVQQLKLLAPKAQLPEIPAARGGRAPAPPAPPPPPPSAPGAPPAPSAPAAPGPAEPGVASRVAGALSKRELPTGKRRTQFFVGAGAGVLLLIVGILAIAGVFGSGDGGDGGCNPVDTSAAEQAGVPTIAMKAAGPAAEADCPPTGQATLTAVQQQTTTTQAQATTFALQLNAADLEPTGEGDTYLLWLYKSDTEAFPLGQQTVSDSGDLTGAVPLNAQQILLLTAFDQIRLARVTTEQVTQVQQSVQNQGKNSTGVVPFVGAPVLEGTIAELGLEQLLQQAQQQAGGGGQGAQPQQGGQGAGAQ
jgi:hypothetical protein